MPVTITVHLYLVRDRDASDHSCVTVVRTKPFLQLMINHGSFIRWLLRICCSHMKENGLFGEKKIRFVTALGQLLKIPPYVSTYF